MSVKKNEISYNLGIAYLHAGNPEEAFNTLISTVSVFGGVSASLWLHLAECCIARHSVDMTLRRGESNETDHMKRLCKTLYGKGSSSGLENETNTTPVVRLKVLGYGDYRKIVLSDKDTACGENKKVDDTSLGPIKPDLSLEYASYCLKNALVIANQNLKNDLMDCLTFT